MKNNSKVKYLVGGKKLNLKSTLPYNDLLCNFLDKCCTSVVQICVICRNFGTVLST